jgi:hypothetical protein
MVEYELSDVRGYGVVPQTITPTPPDVVELPPGEEAPVITDLEPTAAPKWLLPVAIAAIFILSQ